MTRKAYYALRRLHDPIQHTIENRRWRRDNAEKHRLQSKVRMRRMRARRK